MKFYRVYIEITNVCGLSCSFCPTKTRVDKYMDLDFFESLVIQLKPYTKEIACHVVGDPLTRTNLIEYLHILHRHGMRAVLTTSGYFLKKHSYDTMFHPAVKQINISLNSFNKNDTSLSLEQYIYPILDLCLEKHKREGEQFINLRVWNLDDNMSEKSFNNILFKKLSEKFNVELDMDSIYLKKEKTIRVAYKILMHFDRYFEWPSLNNKTYGDGACQGLQSHVAILSDGKVVPCCLDSDGVIELGNLHKDSFEKIVNSDRSSNMIEGFKCGKAVELLCQKCSYKDRFN